MHYLPVRLLQEKCFENKPDSPALGCWVKPQVPWCWSWPWPYHPPASLSDSSVHPPLRFSLVEVVRILNIWSFKSCHASWVINWNLSRKLSLLRCASVNEVVMSYMTLSLSFTRTAKDFNSASLRLDSCLSSSSSCEEWWQCSVGMLELYAWISSVSCKPA